MPKIIGNPTLTPVLPADWNQTDEKKVDYIKNKPDVVAATDYATADKAGVVKVKGDVFTGALFMRADGSLDIFEATEWDFGSPVCAVITTKNLEKAVRFYGDELYATKEEVGDISSALDELHAYAQALIGGAE